REEDLGEDQRRRRSVEEEVVPLDRRADGAGEHGTWQLPAGFLLHPCPLLLCRPASAAPGRCQSSRSDVYERATTMSTNTSLRAVSCAWGRWLNWAPGGVHRGGVVVRLRPRCGACAGSTRCVRYKRPRVRPFVGWETSHPRPFGPLLERAGG